MRKVGRKRGRGGSERAIGKRSVEEEKTIRRDRGMKRRG